MVNRLNGSFREKWSKIYSLDTRIKSRQSDGYRKVISSFHELRLIIFFILDESLISSSNDKTAIIWTQKNGEKLSPEHVLAGHSDHLLIADSISLNSSTFISCTASSDETLCVWRNEILIYSISYKDFIFDIKIIEKRLLDDQIIICFASGDGSVHLSSFNDTDGLQNIAKLKGHEDWVRCLDIISLSEGILICKFKLINFLISQMFTSLPVVHKMALLEYGE